MDSLHSATENDLSAANTFTDTLSVTDGDFVVAVSGTFVGTITLQLRPVVRETATHGWIDEETYTAPIVRQSRKLRGAWEVRAGFKTAQYTSGTAHITLSW